MQIVSSDVLKTCSAGLKFTRFTLPRCPTIRTKPSFTRIRQPRIRRQPTVKRIVGPIVSGITLETAPVIMDIRWNSADA